MGQLAVAQTDHSHRAPEFIVRVLGSAFGLRKQFLGMPQVIADSGLSRLLELLVDLGLGRLTGETLLQLADWPEISTPSWSDYARERQVQFQHAASQPDYHERAR